jgi:hypothetical protein
MSNKPYCIDRVVDEQYQSSAAAANAREHSIADPFELALVGQKMWKPGRILRVRFLDGDPQVQKRVEAYAMQWTQHANIQLQFVPSGPAEVRISFKQDGYWSAVGTDALVTEYFPLSEPTMNFEAFTMATPEAEYSRVVLHEFGHALGCIHEHQSPSGGIQWNKEVVYRALGGPPNSWSKEQVDHNVLSRYNKDQTQFTQFDPRSIMLYSFPKEWTLNNMEFSSNHQLSQTDKEYIGTRYPKPSVCQ